MGNLLLLSDLLGQLKLHLRFLLLSLCSFLLLGLFFHYPLELLELRCFREFRCLEIGHD
jgi:hypothetical protein